MAAVRVFVWRRIVVAATLATTAIAGACHSVDTDPASLAAVSFDTLLSPAVVAGDSLRDTNGVALRLHGNAYNIEGDTLTTFPLRYRVLDSGLAVDSVTGYVVGDTARTTPVRVLLDVNGLQSQPISIFVVPSPDTLATVHGLDSLKYSLRDSTLNISPALSAGVWHRANPTTYTAVQGWVTSFAIQYLPGTDTMVAQLIGSDGRPSRVGISDGSGTAGIRVRIRPALLAALTDSVVIVATAKYLGAPIIGSPVRLVLRVQPPAP